MSKRDRVRDRLIRIVNAKYSVPSWLFVIASTFVGVVILFYAISNPALIAPVVHYLPWDGLIWSSLMIFGGLLTMAGMARDYYPAVRWGSLLSACMWIFGNITVYLAGGIGNILIFAGPILIFWVYKYVASYVREFPRL